VAEWQGPNARLMRCHEKLDRRTEAIGAYRRLRQTLSVTLGLHPSALRVARNATSRCGRSNTVTWPGAAAARLGRPTRERGRSMGSAVTGRHATPRFGPRMGHGRLCAPLVHPKRSGRSAWIKSSGSGAGSSSSAAAITSPARGAVINPREPCAAVSSRPGTASSTGPTSGK